MEEEGGGDKGVKGWLVCKREGIHRESRRWSSNGIDNKKGLGRKGKDRGGEGMRRMSGYAVRWRGCSV